MSSEQTTTMTVTDFRSLVQKLETFRQGLPEGEQAALERLIQEALLVVAGDNDVQGFDLNSLPVPEGDILQAFGVA